MLLAREDPYLSSFLSNLGSGSYINNKTGNLRQPGHQYGKVRNLFFVQHFYQPIFLFRRL